MSEQIVLKTFSTQIISKTSLKRRDPQPTHPQESFSNRDLSSQDFSKTSFIGVSFKKSRAIGVNFKESTFIDVDFSDSDLRNCDFSGSRFVRCKFDRAIVDGMTMHNCEIKKGSFVSVLFKKADIDCTEIHYVDFSHAYFEGGKLYATILCGCKFFKTHFDNRVRISLTRLFKRAGNSLNQYALLSEYIDGNIDFKDRVCNGFIEDYIMPTP